MLSWRSPGHPQAGGAEVLTHEVLRRAVTRGHDVTWFAAAWPGAATHGELDGVRLVRRGRQHTVHVQAWRYARRRLARFDVVVDQINTLPFLTPLYVPEPQRRMFIHQTAREYWWRQTRGAFKLVAPLGYALEPWYLRTYRGTRTLTVSDSTRAELLAFGLPAARVAVMPEAVDVPAVDELAPKAGPLRVLMLGRLEPAKFVEEGIAAFALLAARRPGARLDVAGGGEPSYRTLLEARVAALGLGDRVTFHGRVDDAARLALLDAAHVHLFTSHREGWGLTVTEAARRGVPTVGYDAPGVRDSVRDRRLLAPLAGGPGALAPLLARLAEDGALYDEVRRDAWAFSRTLSFEASTDAFLEAVGA
jgi:glycosyltransferase involved in cell wall biosynthesis